MVEFQKVMHAKIACDL